MRVRDARGAWSVLLCAAVALGVAIAAVDNLALEGEASPILVVALLIGTTVAIGALAPRRVWVAALAVWGWVPLAHLTKHMLGMPDTLRPNTYASIVLLGAVSLFVTVVGSGCGVLARRLASDDTQAGPTSAEPRA